MRVLAKYLSDDNALHLRPKRLRFYDVCATNLTIWIFLSPSERVRSFQAAPGAHDHLSPLVFRKGGGAI